MRTLVLTILLAGCATGADLGGNEQAALARDLEGLVAGAPQRCVSVSQSEGLEIVSSDTLVLRKGDAIWVNRLSGHCPGLRPFSTLIVEPSLSGQYCRNDRISSIEPGSSIAGAACPLGEFTPYRRR